MNDGRVEWFYGIGIHAVQYIHIAENSGKLTREIAVLASKMNAEMEDIGARRLHTMMEQLLEEISFSVCDTKCPSFDIDIEFVRNRLNCLVENRDIRRYLL